MYKIFFWILYLASLVLYATAPNTYNYEINAWAGILFVVSVVLFFKIKRIENLFNFDTLFLLAFGITFFIYPIFLYPINPQYFVMLSTPFNEDVITRATTLSLVGVNSYMCGNLALKRKMVCRHINDSSCKIPDLKIFIIILYIAFIAFIAFGGISYYRDLYQGKGNDSGGLFGYFNVIVRGCVIISIVLQFVIIKHTNCGFRISRVNKFLLLFIVLYSVLLLSTGARGAILNAFLVLIWAYTYYVKPLNLMRFVFLILSGALVLSLVGLYRGGLSIEGFRFWDLFMDLIVNNRNTFVAIDYVDRHGLTYGESMLGVILRAIPFLSGIVQRTFDLDPNEIVSSMILTIEILGENPEYGVGTSIIADLYLAFGLIGVVFFMFILGYLIRYLEFGVQNRQIYDNLLYATFISYSVFMVRGEFFFALGPIVICIIVYYFISRLVFYLKAQSV